MQVYSSTYPRSWVQGVEEIRAAYAAEAVSFREMHRRLKALDLERAQAEKALTKPKRKALLQQCETPPDFWAAVNAVYGFEIDVCALPENAKCARFLSVAEDGLSPSTPWLGTDGHGPSRGWCNPGFEDPFPWHRRAHVEAVKAWGNVMALIGLPGVEQGWARFAQDHADEIINLSPRVNYLVPWPLKQEGNPRGCQMVVYRRKLDPTAKARVITWDWMAAGRLNHEGHEEKEEARGEADRVLLSAG